ncbi:MULTISPECIES: hypothetical protein [Streptomyces]|uniref:Uncharacterized protein n=1 Tax=Streptomyces tricolor TaxID=68277 RepID=A0ABS9JQG4_9ACTN|nr:MULTISPECIES: hypothetical protein [Streptomyces]MCG0067800.1 hypothetical protein [Streptomyces tricolor]MYU27383.1 hypothetical protein [Streptomyces sp. SID7810]
MAERPVVPTAPDLVLATETGSAVMTARRGRHAGRRRPALRYGRAGPAGAGRGAEAGGR